MNKYLIVPVLQAWLCLNPSSVLDAKPPAGELTIEHLGHTSFLISAATGVVPEKLKAVQSQSRSGSLLEDNRTIPLQALWSAEGKWALRLQQAPDVTERFGFTGSFGWHAERGEVGQLPEPLLFVISLALDPQLAMHLPGLFVKLTVAEGSSGDILDGETASGLKAQLSFDSATGLLMRINDTTFEDYRDVGGVMFPFAVTISPGTRARYERIENNISIASTEFEPPT